MLDKYEQSEQSEKAAGRLWYPSANEYCKKVSEEFEVPIELVGAVVSLLSPRNKWGRNKQDAKALISAVKHRQCFSSFSVCTFTSNKQKAWDLAEGVIKKSLPINPSFVFKGPKTRAFFENITNLNSPCVTIDTWAVRAAREVELRWRSGLTLKQYKGLEKEYQEVARHVGEAPMNLQATVWLTVKRQTEEQEKKDKLETIVV